jgi:hypothetical protein
MDWSKYQTIYSYVSRLPKGTTEIQESVRPLFEQSIEYESSPSMIQPVERLHLEFHNIRSEKFQSSVNTQSLWSAVTGILEETNYVCNRSMQKCNTQLLVQHLRNYLVDKTIYSFLTGRRVYPLLELLDKPRVDFEKKHQTSLGYFLSFLLHKTVTIQNEKYQWSRDCMESSIHLKKNEEGYWSLEKEIKNENV